MAVELEERLAHLERLAEELSDEIAKQSRDLATLQRQVAVLVDREAARWVGAELDLQRAPTLGEHNQYVLQDILGLDDEAFVQLLADNVVS